MEKSGVSHLVRSLKEKRKRIDLIDQKLLTLLNQRLVLALEIGKIKRERGEKIHNPSREKEILRRLNTINQGPLKEEDLKKIFKPIMLVCRKSQAV